MNRDGILFINSISRLQEEVVRARKKHPEQYQDKYKAIAVLVEEVGELAKDFQENCLHWKKEALQVATVAMRIYEEIES
jgi:NTP pyrophosphatase (non-canonical NTP hydrolase)